MFYAEKMPQVTIECILFTSGHIETAHITFTNKKKKKEMEKKEFVEI